MDGRGSISLSIAAIGATVAGLALEAPHLTIAADTLRTFIVAALAGYAATMACRAMRWRIRGQ